MKKLMIIVLILIAGASYFLTLPKGIGFGDSGTMAAAAVSLGIPHPPGFPTYVLLGYFFSLLPIGSILWRLQLLSLIPAVGIVILVFMMVFKKNELIPAMFSAFLATFFYGFWSQAGNVESYMLTNLFIFGVIWLGLFRPPTKIMGLLLGLGAGLNPIGVVVVPVLLYLFRLSKKTLVIFLTAVPTAVLVYTYLPIRAFTYPFLNWGNPQTIASFLKYITGSGLNINSGVVVNGFTGSIWWYIDAWSRFGYLAWTQLTPLVMALSLLGAWYLWQEKRATFWVLIIILFTNISLAGIYVSGNRDIWLITSLIILIILAGDGLVRLGKMGWIVGIITLAIVVWISAPKILERTKINISGKYLSDIYQNLPKDSILIGGGETFNSLTLYAYKVAKMRPDVTPIDMTIFYGQDWYRKNVKSPASRGEQKSPLRPSTPLRATEGQANLKTDLTEQIKFTDDLEFSRVLENFADINPNRPIFVTGYLLTQSIYANSLRPAYMPQTYHLQQKGLVYQLAKTDIPPVELKNYPLTWSTFNYQENNFRKAIDLITMEYSLALEKTGDYFLNVGKEKEAFDRYTKAMQIAPKYFDQNRLREKVVKTEKLIN